MNNRLNTLRSRRAKKKKQSRNFSKKLWTLLKSADRTAYQLTLTDREILPEEPNPMTAIRKALKSSFESINRDRRAPVKISKKIRSRIQLRDVLNGIEPTLGKIASTANFVSNALGKGDIV